MANAGTPSNPRSRMTIANGRSSFRATGAQLSSASNLMYLGEVTNVTYPMGEATFRSAKNYNNIPSKNANAKAIPLLTNIRIYPVVGELILIIELGKKYYLPVNLLNSVVLNKSIPIYSDTRAQQQQDDTDITPETFDGTRPVPDIKMLEGDIAFLGRFGQSIKFGSTVKKPDTGQLEQEGESRGLTNYSNSEQSNNGDPIIIIRNDGFAGEENIVQDPASIYICTSQQILVDNNENGFEGVTDAWSTINLNSDDYTAQIIQLINQPVENDDSNIWKYQEFEFQGTGIYDIQMPESIPVITNVTPAIVTTPATTNTPATTTTTTTIVSSGLDPEKEDKELSNKFNFHLIPDGKNNYRSAQFTDQELPLIIKKYNIKRVLRLNGDGNDSKHRSGYTQTSIATEKSICESNGCEFTSFSSHKGYKNGQGYTESIQKTVDILSRGNALIHCAHGADRTGGMVGGYLKTQGIVTDKDVLWKYTTQYNGWQSMIRKGTFFGSGYDKYADGFYPIDELQNSKWVK